MTMRVRFAPSPTGNLHLGTLRTALFNWLLARHNKGTFILRTEDTDLQRSKPEFEVSILEGMKWMGLTIDEGPNEGGAFGPYRQSERIEQGLYHQYAHQLIMQKKAYRCFCTNEDLDAERAKADAEKRPYVYSRKCLDLSPTEIQDKIDQGIPYTIRFQMPTGILRYNDLIRGDIEFDLSLISDFVIIKSDNTPSYNFAVVVDDMLMKATHVVRGEDHISNTPKQIALFNAFKAEPPQFAHMPMILGSDKSKLSKRHGATNVIDYREQGFLPEALFNYMALLGWSPVGEQELFTRSELVEQFTLDRVAKAGAVFDMVKLTWMNGQYIRKLDPQQLYDAVKPFFNEKTDARLSELPHNIARGMCVTVQDNLNVLSDINEHLEVYLLSDDDYKEKMSEHSFDDATQAVLKQAKDKIETLPDNASEADFTTYKDELLQETGLGMGKVFKPLRIAISGQGNGPHIIPLMTVIGKETLLKRLDYVLNR